MKIIRDLLFAIALITMLVFITNSASAITDTHYHVQAESIHAQDLQIRTHPVNDDKVIVNFLYDLNYLDFSVPPDQLRHSETYTVHNWYATDSIDIDDCSAAFLNGNTATCAIYDELLPNVQARCEAVNPSWFENIVDPCLVQNSFTSCEAYGGGNVCEWISDPDSYKHNYVGLPFYLTYCEIDCDYDGDTATCQGEGDGGGVHYPTVLDYIIDNIDPQGLDFASDVVYLRGWLPYTDEPVSELENTPGFIKTDYAVRTRITKECPASSTTIRAYCEVARNPFYRHSSPTDNDYTYEEILPVTYVDLDMNDKIDSCLDVTLNETISQYTYEGKTAQQHWDAYGTDGLTTNTSGGIYIPQQQFGIMDLPYYRIQENLRRQSEFEEQVNFLDTMIELVDLVGGMIMLLYYGLLVAFFGFFLFVLVPGTFRDMLDVYRELFKRRP